MFMKRPPALAPEEHGRRARAPKRVRSTFRATLAHRLSGLSPGDFIFNPFLPVPSSLHRVPPPPCPWVSEYGLLGGTLSALKPIPRRTVLHSGDLASGTLAIMGRVFFSVPVNSVRRARCSCPGRCYLSCRIPPTAALQAPSGLGCARVPGKAAGGAVGSGPSGTGGFLSGPTFQAPGSWKDSVGAPPAPDVSLQPHCTQPGCAQ